MINGIKTQTMVSEFASVVAFTKLIDRWINVTFYQLISCHQESVGRELSDADISNISSRLLKHELQCLAIHLGVSQTQINSSYSDKSAGAEAANHSLRAWLLSKNDRKEAYSEMGTALVKVKLNLIAREVLDFLPKQK